MTCFSFEVAEHSKHRGEVAAKVIFSKVLVSDIVPNISDIVKVEGENYKVAARSFDYDNMVAENTPFIRVIAFKE